jgi:hypothetical protein
LRENKVQIGSLQRKLKEHTENSEMTKKKYADWNAELSRKLQDLREQKRNWVSETAALRLAEKELRVCTFLIRDIERHFTRAFRHNLLPKEIY